MKFNTNLVSDVVQSGDINKNNVSIDTDNIDFIVTILSTNLYSKPIESFIRETVSNAWDSHVEAGVTDPVILDLLRDPEGDIYCRIQDFGVGLSPERFDKIYRNIGSSSKRDSNNQIGGFGIGRFSALAYQDVVIITSCHNGTKYIYQMYKDGNSISIDMLHSSPTDERNGVEVKLQVKEKDFYNFEDAIANQLVYFQNLYVVCSVEKEGYQYNRKDFNIADSYNNFKVVKYDNFSVNNFESLNRSNYGSMDLILGKVRYPIRFDALDVDFRYETRNKDITLNFEIGDLAVTPNREEILYNETNIKKIEAKIQAAEDEILKIAAERSTADFTDMWKLYKEYKSTRLVLLEDDNSSREVAVQYDSSKTDKKFTLNGEDLVDLHGFCQMYQNVIQARAFELNYNLYNKKMKYVNRLQRVDGIKDNFNTSFFCDVASLNNMSKRYIRETFEDDSFFYGTDYYKAFRKIVWLLSDDILNDDLSRHHRKLICAYFKDKLSKIPVFKNSSVPAKWITDTKAADKLKRGVRTGGGFNWSEKINVHVMRYANNGYVTTDSVAYKYEDLKPAKVKKQVIYAPKGTVEAEKLRTFYEMIGDYRAHGNNKHFRMTDFYEIAPTKIKLVKDIPGFLRFEDILTKPTRQGSKIATVAKIQEEVKDLRRLADQSAYLADLNKEFAADISVLNNFCENYIFNRSNHDSRKELLAEILAVYEETKMYDLRMLALVEKHRNKWKLNSLFNKLSMYDSEMLILIGDYIKARKLFKIEIELVNKINKNENDENNEN
jgi:hypothetical protein